MRRLSSATLFLGLTFLSGFVFPVFAQTVTAKRAAPVLPLARKPDADVKTLAASAGNSPKWWNTALVAADCPSPSQADGQDLSSITRRIHPDLCEESQGLVVPAGTHQTFFTSAEYEESAGIDVSSMPQCIARDLAGNMLTYWWASDTHQYFMDPHCPPWIDLVESRVDKLIGREGIYQDNICGPNFIKAGGGWVCDLTGQSFLIFV